MRGRPWRPRPAAGALALLLLSAPLLPREMLAQEPAQEPESEELPPAAGPAPAPYGEPGAYSVPAPPPLSEVAAEQLYQSGDLAGAAALYRRLAVAASEAGERMRLLVLAAWLEHQIGNSGGAYDLLLQGLADVPDHAFAAQNFDQPFVDLYVRAREHVLHERRQRAGELVRRSHAEIEAGDLERARATLAQAITLAPDNAFALFNLALVEMRDGRRDEAIAGFERLVSLEAGRPGSVPPEVRSPTLATLGLLYYEKDFLDEARRFLDEATALDPDSARTWNNLGLTLRRQGDAAGAERAFRRARELAPADPQPANNLGLLLIAAERWTEAVAVLADATARAADNAAAWLNLGLAQRGAGDRAAAVRALERALALDEANAAGLGARAASYLAVVRYEQGDIGGAAASAARALAWRPDDLEAWVYQGLAQQLQGDPAGARDSFRRALQIDPARAELHNNLGTALVSLDDLEGAAAAFRQALALSPDFAAARSNLDEVTARLAAGPSGSRPLAEGRGAAPRPERRPRPLGARFGRDGSASGGARGAPVEAVQEDGPAGRAGLRRGDMVLAVDGKPIQDAQQLLTYIERLDAARGFVELDILRDGRPQRLRVELD